MKLIKLALNNFKGINEFWLETAGKNCSVYGDNGTGKTTLKDAVTWLLFDKGSDGKSLNPKKLDSTGQEINHLNHMIEAIFSTESGEVSLKKCFSEKWTKKRGDAAKSFTGHKTEYWVDGVPVKRKEYVDKVSMIATMEQFQLLSDIDYFPGKMHWEKRRNLLLEICGDISDQDIIAENESLQGMDKIIASHSIDDYKKILQEKRKAINDQLDKIPTRIDEADKSKYDTEGQAITNITAKIFELDGNIAREMEKKSSIENNEEVSILKREMATIETSMAQLETKKEKEAAKETAETRKDLAALVEKKNNSIADQWTFQRDEKQCREEINSLESHMAKLRTKWKTVDNEIFDENTTICPTCKRGFDQKKSDELQASFNTRKSCRLEEISENGKKLAGDKQIASDSFESVVTKLKATKEYKDKLAVEIKNAQDEINKSRSTSQENLDTFNDLNTRRNNLTTKITSLEGGNESALQEVKDKINSIQAELDSAKNKAMAFDHNAKIDSRIKDLEREEKNLAIEYEKLESDLFLTEEFTRAKVAMLEGKINAKFTTARFKLFEDQINGGLKEICSVIFDGVPYESGLNNAARINVGIDIVNTLSDHYDLLVPLFIDNAEAVVSLAESKSQIIRLVVSGEDNELRQEIN